MPCELVLQRDTPSSMVLPSAAAQGATAAEVVVQNIVGEGAIGGLPFVVSNCTWDSEPPAVGCSIAAAGCFPITGGVP